MKINITEHKLAILYFTTSIVASDGWSRYSSGLVSEVSKSYDTRVLTVDSSGIKKLPSPSFSIKNLITVFKSSWNEIHKDQIVHVLVEPYAFPVALVCFLKRAKLTLTLHGTYSRITLKSIFRSTQILASLLIANSATSGSMEVIKEIPLQRLRRKIEFIPNGVDLSRFFPVHPSNQLIELTNYRNYFLCVGEIKKRKGQDLAIEALSRLNDESCLLIIVGKCSESVKDQLTTLSRDLKVEDRVVFTGYVDEDFLRELYSNAIATVLFARQSKHSTEGFPMVIYESNACGTPIIISSGFGSDYAIIDEINGFLVPQQDVELATLALSKALGIFSKSESMELMKRNCEHEAAKHIWSILVLHYFDLYRIPAPYEN